MEEKVRQKMTMQMEEMEVDVAELYTSSLQSFESIGVIPIVLYEGWSLKEEYSSNSEPLFNRLMQHRFTMTVILWVRHLFLNKKDGRPEGTIKDGGILCSCSICKGSKVVTAYKFERHAGSGQKHASNNIHSENGNNLLDVLDACLDVPMDHIRWLVLRGKTAILESQSLPGATQEKRQSLFKKAQKDRQSLLEKAINIFHREDRGSRFLWDVYCSIDCQFYSVVSAGILRVFGKNIGELPLVATSTESEGGAYFQLLFARLQSLFGYLNVKHTVLPSADELKAI